MKTLLFLLPLFCFAQHNLPADICNTLSDLKAKDQQIRGTEILNSYRNQSYTEDEVKEAWQKQIALDNQNTEKLLELTEQYGWLSDERVNCDKKTLVFLVFRHSQPQYFDRIRKVIEQEREAGHLSEWHYKIIDNHLKGRPRMR